MAKVIGYQYTYNGPGYLDAKIQPVETVADLDSILLRQRFVGLTVTVIHPDGADSKPADYWLVQDPNEEEGVLMWERKTIDVEMISVDTHTSDYIQVTKDGSTYYVDAAGNLVSDIEEIKSGLTITNERVDALETEVSSLTETVTTEVQRIDEKNTEQDELINEFSQWHLEKISEASGVTEYALVDGSGHTIGDTIEITEEQYLEQVIYIPSATEADKAIDDTVIIGDPYLKFIWKYDIITYVAIKDWVNDYFAGPGIDISAGHEVSVKLAEVDDDNQNYLTVDDNGLKMNMFIEIDE